MDMELSLNAFKKLGVGYSIIILCCELVFLKMDAKIESKPYSEKIKINDFSLLTETEAEQEAQAVRRRLSHRKLKIEEGEVAGLELTLLPGNKTRLHIDLDLLIADVQSLQILLRDLAMVYSGVELPEESKDWNFAAYLEQQNVEDREERKKRRSTGLLVLKICLRDQICH